MGRLFRLINQIVVKAGLAKSKCRFPMTLFCSDFPDELAKDTIYVMGSGKYLYSVAFVCPCNMGHIVQLSLHQDEHPYWNVQFHINGTVTLKPSIWYKNGCRSHYFVKRGLVLHV